jgi:hypothetical protein
MAEEMSRATMGSLLVSTGLGAVRAFTFDSFRGRRGLGPPMSRFRVLACVGGIPRATKVDYCEEYLEGPACLHLRKPEKLFSRCRSDNVRETACDNLALHRISVNMRSCAFCIFFPLRCCNEAIELGVAQFELSGARNLAFVNAFSVFRVFVAGLILPVLFEIPHGLYLSEKLK